jgi:hypothetical protein
MISFRNNEKNEKNNEKIMTINIKINDYFIFHYFSFFFKK